MAAKKTRKNKTSTKKAIKHAQKIVLKRNIVQATIEKQQLKKTREKNNSHVSDSRKGNKSSTGDKSERRILAVTHSSRFHADDVFAAATLSLVYPAIRIVRTRDEEILSQADIVFDVGNVYDQDTLRFDHHQIGGAGRRTTGSHIPYAAFGLVWKKFGVGLCGSKDVALLIENSFVQYVDAMDNGVDVYTNIHDDVHPYTIQSMIFALNPTWREKSETTDSNFFIAVEIAKKIIIREIEHALTKQVAVKAVSQAYEHREHRHIVMLDQAYPYHEILDKYADAWYVILPDRQSTNWKVEALRVKPGSYAVKKKFPESWAGKRETELAEQTGVLGSVFCHNARFLAVARTREEALQLAYIAVDAQ